MGISIWPSMEQGSQVEVNGVRSMKGDPQVEVNRGGVLKCRPMEGGSQLELNGVRF